MFDLLGKFLDNAQTTGGVTGTLALMIAATLCIVFIRNPTQNHEIGKALILALTAIIGFYFGAITTKNAPPTSPPSASANSATTK
jgi:hypothetical protein